MQLKEVKGIGPRALMLLGKLNINTIEDLVTCYPFRYEKYERNDLTKTLQDEHIVIDGKVESTPILMRFKAGLNKMNFRLVSQTGIVGVSIFNRAFLKNKLLVGTSVIVIGKFDKAKNIITASDVKFGTLSTSAKLEPVYHLTSGLTNKNMVSFINQALLDYGNNIPDYTPDIYKTKYSFLNKKTALNIVHNPPSEEKLNTVIERLKYEELFAFMFKINYLRTQNKLHNRGLCRNIDRKKIDKFTSKLSFELTGDQKKVISDILDDLDRPSRMNRLIQGDVGSGKTIVSFVAMYANYLSGYQSALMAPTEILAIQHYENIKEIFKGMDINIEILTGSTSKKDKKIIYDELSSGKINIIIGTHALIQEEVIYDNLGLVVTDEQHRFGVNQRENLQNKGLKPDILYMSATPIPRTYALTIYGDMDMSTIKEKPKGRQDISTYVKSNKEIKDVLKMMLQELKSGHQVYVIAPLIEESEKSDLTDVNKLKDQMKQAFKDYFKIDIIHGKMPSQAKDLIMKEFAQGEIKILISTTVIEVGVDVKNATMMVIFDANRFGLSTLHQLRGRVGRGEEKSKCVLISDVDTKRLKVMEKTNDGFVISEEDFKLRGHGDIFGTRQSGDMTFKIANLKRDYKILLQTKKDSMDYLENKDTDNDELKNNLIKTIKNA